LEKTGYGNESDVNGIKHHLNAYEDDDGIAPSQRPNDSNREEYST
jgi:hypothetical protein